MAGNGLESLNPGQHGEPASLPGKSPFELEMAQKLSLLSSTGNLSVRIGGFGANTLSAVESLSLTGTQTQLPDIKADFNTYSYPETEGLFDEAFGLLEANFNASGNPKSFGNFDLFTTP